MDIEASYGSDYALNGEGFTIKVIQNSAYIGTSQQPSWSYQKLDTVEYDAPYFRVNLYVDDNAANANADMNYIDIQFSFKIYPTIYNKTFSLRIYIDPSHFQFVDYSGKPGYSSRLILRFAHFYVPFIVNKSYDYANQVWVYDRWYAKGVDNGVGVNVFTPLEKYDESDSFVFAHSIIPDETASEDDGLEFNNHLLMEEDIIFDDVFFGNDDFSIGYYYYLGRSIERKDELYLSELNYSNTGHYLPPETIDLLEKVRYTAGSELLGNEVFIEELIGSRVK
jgi:hypothetical protein